MAVTWDMGFPKSPEAPGARVGVSSPSRPRVGQMEGCAGRIGQTRLGREKVWTREGVR